MNRTAPSEKELAVFRAVIALIEEEVDVNTMKVSDITARAGIGKGTAYEYFSSKEEMVAEAIFWAGRQEAKKLTELLDTRSTMKEQLLAVMEYIRTEMCSRKFNTQLLKVLGHSCEIKEKLTKEVEGCGLMQQNIEPVISRIISQGKKEGKIASDMKHTLIYMTIMSGFISYFVYQNQPFGKEDVSSREMEEFLCRNIMRNLAEPFS